MAHYAFLDSNNIVTEVIVGQEESNTQHNWETYYGNLRDQTCKRTSYNTSSGVHLDDGTPFRKNYAGIGYTYDLVRDAFIPEQPYASWTKNLSTATWEPPIAKPSLTSEQQNQNNQKTNKWWYDWNETTQAWDLTDALA